MIDNDVATAFGIILLIMVMFILGLKAGTNVEQDRIRQNCMDRNNTSTYIDVKRMCDEFVK